MLGEPFLLLADPVPAVPAAEIAPRPPDPDLQPIHVGNVDIPVISQSDMEMIEDEFDAVKSDMTALKASLAQMEDALVKHSEMLAKISRVLIRKLGSLD